MLAETRTSVAAEVKDHDDEALRIARKVLAPPKASRGSRFCCPHSVERHAYNGCANCGCAVRWDEHPDRDHDRSEAGIQALLAARARDAEILARALVKAYDEARREIERLAPVIEALRAFRETHVDDPETLSDADRHLQVVRMFKKRDALLDALAAAEGTHETKPIGLSPQKE